jgi:hypothetical protein
MFLSKGILVRHTSLIESELKAPSNVTSNWIYYYQFPILLHVSALSGHPQKERGRLLVYQRHLFISGPIPHVVLLYMQDTGYLTLIRYNISCVRASCSSDSPMIEQFDNNQHNSPRFVKC